MRCDQYGRRWRSIVSCGAAALSVAAVAGACSRPHGASSRNYVFRVGSTHSATNADTMAVKKWATAVKKDTDGHVKIQVSPNNALGSDTTQITAMVRGSQFGYLASSDDLESYTKLASVVDLPYTLPDDSTRAQSILAGPVGHTIDTTLPAHGMINLGWVQTGLRAILSKKRVVTPADLNGVKMRVPPAPTKEQAYKLLGADIDPISYNQVYTGMLTGTVTGVENAPGDLADQKFDQVAKNLAQVNMVRTLFGLVISKKMLDSLPSSYQKVVTKDATGPIHDEWAASDKQNDAAVAILKKAGVHVNAIHESVWKSALESFSANYAKKEGTDVYQLYQKLVGATDNT